MYCLTKLILVNHKIKQIFMQLMVRLMAGFYYIYKFMTQLNRKVGSTYK